MHTHPPLVATARQRPSAVVFVALLLAALVLAACGSRGVEQPTAVATIALAPTQPPTVTPAPTASPLPTATATPVPTATPIPTATPSPTPTPLNPLSIAYLRQQETPGSDIVIEQTLAPGANYDRYVASYDSEGLKQYAMLTVPRGQQPDKGWPVIVFNHGYIPPSQYRTTERYVAYVDGFAGAGYIVFRPDYRGNGSSEGSPSGAYGSQDYVIDVLNAVSSIKRYPGADPGRIGMWGHSIGGWITLRAMVASDYIKAGVIWGGVVASYEDLLTRWRRSDRLTPSPGGPGRTGGRWRSMLLNAPGTAEQNPTWWQALSANYFLDDLSGPIQLHHAQGDASVPVEFSQTLYEQGLAAGAPIQLFTYPGDNHNISGNFATAMARSVEFFDKTLAIPIPLKQTSVPTLFAGGGPVNLRSGPGTGFAVAGSLEAGGSLPLIGRSADGEWWQVQAPGGPAWAAASVTIAAHYAQVPVVDV